MKGQEGKHFRLHDHLVRKAVSQLCYYATKAEETTHKWGVFPNEKIHKTATGMDWTAGSGMSVSPVRHLMLP